MKYDERYLAAPPAEVFEHGFAVAHVWCADITADGPGYDDGLPAVLYPDGHRPDDAGKLLIWGRCMSYVRTYLEQRGGFDLCKHRHRRLFALWQDRAGGRAFDERIRHIASVCSGTAGTAVVRGKVGETVQNISTYAPHWFCGKYGTYADREDDLPFDAHFIVAALAPRNLLVTGALEDYWCDPYWELLACVAGSPAHELLGKPGFLYEGPQPVPGYRYPCRATSSTRATSPTPCARAGTAFPGRLAAHCGVRRGEKGKSGAFLSVWGKAAFGDRFKCTAAVRVDKRAMNACRFRYLRVRVCVTSRLGRRAADGGVFATGRQCSSPFWR